MNPQTGSNNDTAKTAVPELSLGAIFLKFLRFGLLAFGGPVAQIAMLRQALVDDERWIDQARFNRLIAVLQVLPGPEAHELCVHLGMVARGRWGGLLAGLGFMLPGLILMLAAAWAYDRWLSGIATAPAILLAVQIALLAIILRAVVRIGQHVIDGRLLAIVGLLGLFATLANVPFWIALATGGAVLAFSHRPAAAIAALTAGILAAVLSQMFMPADVGAVSMLDEPVTMWALFGAGLKGGLLTFGGAYTAIPYLRADTVGRGWLNDATFLDGVAIAGLLPAPLVIFATFIGYVVGGVGGALAVTAGMFLPAFAFSMIFFERLEAIVENPALGRMLGGVAAAVVGIIGATWMQLAGATAMRVTSPIFAATIFLVALGVVWRVKGAWVTPAMIGGALFAGWAATVK